MKCIVDLTAETILELEKQFQFKFAPSLCFETVQERGQIKERGLLKLQNSGVSAQAQELGKRYVDQIEASVIPHVSVRFVNEKIGLGLFLEETIPAGTYVGEYTGIVRKNDRRYFEPLNNYCYEYPVADEIGRNYVIDATSGHLTRFINHSYTPNLQSIHVFLDGFYHLIFLALVTIEAGTQLSFDYGRNYWYIRSAPGAL